MLFMHMFLNWRYITYVPELLRLSYSDNQKRNLIATVFPKEATCSFNTWNNAGSESNIEGKANYKHSLSSYSRSG